MARSIAWLVRGASGMMTTLPPLRVMVGVRASALQPEVLDVRAGGLGDPQPIQRQQRDQRMLELWPEPAATRSAPSSLQSRAVA